MRPDAFNGLSAQEAQLLTQRLPNMTVAEKMRLMDMLEERERRSKLDRARASMLGHAHHLYPGFKEGPHHRMLSRILEDVITGKKKRVIVNIAPRMGKSEFSSYLFPSYFIGKFPDKKIIMGTHTSGLSEDFGRRVKNLVDTKEYQELYPGTQIAADQKAAGKWSTSAGGQYYAVGVGGSIAGRGADLFVIDDPHSEQDVKANSTLAFDSAWAWYQTGPLQRLMPGGAILIIMCMTGDTDVLCADGTTRKLRDIRPGDEVATYEHGGITTSRVANWRSNGVDTIFTVKTQSGRILRANERHPFLVDYKGDRRWVRLQELKPGMLLVVATDATAPQDLSATRGCAMPARHGTATTEKTQTPSTCRLGTTDAGRGCCVRAGSLCTAAACASCAIGNNTHRPSELPSKPALHVSNTATASRSSSTTKWWQRAATAVTSVVSRLLKKTPVPTGAGSCASTIATTPSEFGGCCATTATSLSGTGEPLTCCCAPLSTYAVTLDEIVSITPDGREEVFDVEIERTENFIANGVVSHNTRWSKKDLTGRLIDHQIKNPDSTPWEIIELPAILHEDTANEKSLWPEQWPLEELKSKKAGMDPQFWNAQYMQQPTSDKSAIIARTVWQVWTGEKPPKVEFVIQSWDTAFESKQTADYSACTTWGVWYDAERGNRASLILLDAFKDRMEFPELKATALKHYREWKPDAFIVEKKAAGAPLIQELRRAGIPVQEFSPSRGNDKIVRLNAVSDLFATGVVWAPDTRWAKEVIEEVASFPNGDNDDYVDTVSQALLRYRQGGFIPLDSDELDEAEQARRYRRKTYY